MNILVIHGPNLHLLKIRKPEIYGNLSLRQINDAIKKRAKQIGVNIRSFQSNCEGEIIDAITSHSKWADAIIINPAAYTHYSYAIRDAIEAVNIPTVEVHLTNILKRESFRRISVIKPVCKKRFFGEGVMSYIKALNYMAAYLRRK